MRAANVNRVSREKVRINPRSFIAAVYAKKNNCILSSLKNIKILKFLSILTNFLQETQRLFLLPADPLPASAPQYTRKTRPNKDNIRCISRECRNLSMIYSSNARLLHSRKASSPMMRNGTKSGTWDLLPPK